MDEDRLRQIRERLEAATPGPLKMYPTAPGAGSQGWAFIRSRAKGYDFVADVTRPEDAELWVHAPTDIADLLAEVERLWGLAWVHP